MNDLEVVKYRAVAALAWVRPNPSILRRGFSNSSIFEKESMKIQVMGSRTHFSKFLNPSIENPTAATAEDLIFSIFEPINRSMGEF